MKKKKIPLTMKEAARLFASMGGQATSPAKAEAARRNGAKGGRPRKNPV